jgi:hypothetical protein
MRLSAAILSRTSLLQHPVAGMDLYRKTSVRIAIHRKVGYASFQRFRSVQLSMALFSSAAGPFDFDMPYRGCTMQRWVRSLGLIALLCWTVSAQAQAPQSAPSAPSKDKPHVQGEQGSDALIAEEVRQRLKSTVTFKSENSSLAEVLSSHIATPSKLDVYFDPQIEASGIGIGEIVVTGDFKNTSIRAVLTRILAPAKLAYYCDDTGVCITTMEAHNDRLFSRVYDVTDLIPVPEISKGLKDSPYYPPPQNSSSRKPTSIREEQDKPEPTTMKLVQLGGHGMIEETTVEYRGEDAVWNQKLTAVSLTAAVKQATGGNITDPWSPQGGRGTVCVLDTGRSKLMVVRQTEAVHGEIEDLLSEVFTHHQMQKPDRQEGPTGPKTAKMRIVRPQVRTVQQQ